MGLIAMSERDLQRIEILSKVIAGRMTLVSAAHVLGLSTRQVRRLLDRISAGGAASVGRERCHCTNGPGSLVAEFFSTAEDSAGSGWV
ncbi:transposase (plasmid) [Sinorhizobium americanum CCGM7]|nr:transposase [Sinorhizobium americanum CCGM7]